MAKIKLKYKKNVIFAIQFYFLYFYNVNDDQGTFINSRIRLFILIKLAPYIYIPELGDLEKKQAFILQMNRTEQRL